jgi:hypothetical protein
MPGVLSGPNVSENAGPIIIVNGGRCAAWATRASVEVRGSAVACPQTTTSPALMMPAKSIG